MWAMSFLCMAMPVKAENEDPYIQLIDGFYYYLTSSSAVLTRAFNIQYNDMEVVRIPDTVYYKGKSYASQMRFANHPLIEFSYFP